MAQVVPHSVHSINCFTPVPQPASHPSFKEPSSSATFPIPVCHCRICYTERESERSVTVARSLAVGDWVLIVCGWQTYSNMADTQPITQPIKERADALYFRAQQNAPLNRRQVLGLVTILVGIATVVTLAGLALTGTTITFLLASPLLLLFSPILVPLAVIAFFSIGSLLGFGGFVSFVVWTYKYYKGGHPVGSDQVDAARFRISEGANQVKDKAAKYSEEAKNYVRAKTDTSSAA